jgi:hypothetical protein
MGFAHRSTAPDLFSAAPARGVATPTPATKFAKTTPTSTERHILPNNLPAAIKHLTDGELDQLLSAVLAEQKRRGRKPPGSNETPRKQQVEATAPPLTQGKLNAVRAAFKAGVTPSRIARQFGITQSQVRKALAADKATG